MIFFSKSIFICSQLLNKNICSQLLNKNPIQPNSSHIFLMLSVLIEKWTRRERNSHNLLILVIVVCIAIRQHNESKATRRKKEEEICKDWNSFMKFSTLTEHLIKNWNLIKNPRSSHKNLFNEALNERKINLSGKRAFHTIHSTIIKWIAIIIWWSVATVV